MALWIWIIIGLMILILLAVILRKIGNSGNQNKTTMQRFIDACCSRRT